MKAYSHRAGRKGLDIDPKQRQRIQKALDRMLSELWASDLKKLRGQSDIRGLRIIDSDPMISLARLGRFERSTYGLEVRCSIQLSYRRAGSWK